MNKINIGIFAVAIIATLLISGCTTETTEKVMDKDEAVDNTAMIKTEPEMIKNDSEMMRKESDMIEKEAEMMKTEPEMMTSGSYESYTPEKLVIAKGNIVLFFHASWCPSCRGLNSDIEKNLDNIPSDLTVLKVDYDKETALKQKYGVTTQHTLVQVDNEGSLIKKWSGGSSLERLVSQVE